MIMRKSGVYEVTTMSLENISKDKSAEKAHAYTPSLKVKSRCLIKKSRILPIKGKVLVSKGDNVDFETIVARTYIPGNPVIIRADEILGVPTTDVMVFMIKKIGDEVEENEIMGRYSPFFGLFKKEIKSPISGTLESYSETTGQMILRGENIVVDVNAYIKGKISEVIPEEGVVIETEGSFIQGIFGIGGERQGEIHVVAESIDDLLTEDKILPDHSGKIIIGGKCVTLEAIKKASQLGVKGIVTGGIKGEDIKEFLGYDIGVAITGEEEINLSIIVTEGFGEMKMSNRIFNLFKKLEGKQAAINGTTQIRAGVIRPEIIIPLDFDSDSEEDTHDLLSEGMTTGTPLRIIAEPYFGEIGEVLNLPVQLQSVETGSLVRVLDVMLRNGKKVTVPRANVEIIEE